MSAQVKERTKENQTSQQAANLQVRDLYKQEKKLKRWPAKVKEDLEGTDLVNVQKFVQYMRDAEKSTLWTVRCITALLSMRRQLGKSFRKATKDDMRALLAWMDEQEYKPATHEKYRQVIKLFYKQVYGKGKTCSAKVAWFSSKVTHEKRLTQREQDHNKYLETEEVQTLIDHASTVQRRAFLGCLYELDARSEEYLRLTNLDIKRGVDSIQAILRGKTGERQVPMVAYTAMLEQWLAVHPLKDQPVYPLWISEAINYKKQPLGLRGAEKIMEETMVSAGLGHKRTAVHPQALSGDIHGKAERAWS